MSDAQAGNGAGASGILSNGVAGGADQQQPGAGGGQAGTEQNNASQQGADKSQQPANWYDSIDDADLKGYLSNKGWKDPKELAVGYRNLEKLVGQDKVPLPKDDADKDGWARVYDSLGRPKTADDYKLPVPEGVPPDFAKAASSKFHELGLSARQATALTEWWNGQSQGQMQAQQQQQQQQREQELSALRREWGTAWNENVALGSNAARQFGLDEEKLTKIENAIGTREMMGLMARIGRGLTEHNFEGGKSTNSFGLTPESAQAKIKELQNDQAWVKKYFAGDAEANAQMKSLMAKAYPDN